MEVTTRNYLQVTQCHSNVCRCVCVCVLGVGVLLRERESEASLLFLPRFVLLGAVLHHNNSPASIQAFQ